VCDVTATSFPLSKHTGGGDTAPAFSGQCAYLQLTWEVVLPPSPVVFLLLPLLQAFPLLVAWHVPLLLPSRVYLFIYSSVRDTFPLSLELRVPHPLCNMSLLFLLFIIQFLFFPLGGGWSVQGAMLIWPRVVYESTTCSLAHLVVRVFPSLLGAGVWRRPGGPPGFSV
jgi:hypothetical protein